MHSIPHMTAGAIFSRILVPTDFSPGSAEAWRMAQRLAPAVGADLVLMHVLDEADFLRSLEPEERRADAWSRHSAGELNIAPDPREGEAPTTAQEWAETQLDEWAAPARVAGLPVQTVLRAGVAQREIVAAVSDLRADLIVLSTHGRGGIDRFLHGSVADPVIRTAPCPVLAVRRLPTAVPVA